MSTVEPPGSLANDQSRNRTIETLSTCSREHLKTATELRQQRNVGRRRQAASSETIQKLLPLDKLRIDTSNRNFWPPSPQVEDEVTSVLKEKDPPLPVVTDEQRAPARGVVDQDPILLEASLPFASPRIVDVVSTPPTSAESSPVTSRRSVKFSDIDQVRVFQKFAEIDGARVSQRNSTPRSPADTSKRHGEQASKDRTTFNKQSQASARDILEARPEWLHMTSDAREETLINALRGQGRPRDGSHGGRREDSRRPKEINISQRGSFSATNSPVTTPPGRKVTSDYFSPMKSSRPERLSANLAGMPPSPPRSPQNGGRPAPRPNAPFPNSGTSTRSNSPDEASMLRANAQKRSSAQVGQVRELNTLKNSKLGSSVSIPDKDEVLSIEPRMQDSNRRANKILPYPCENSAAIPFEESMISRPKRSLDTTAPMPASSDVNVRTLEADKSLRPDLLRVDRPPLIKRHTHDGNLPASIELKSNQDGIDKRLQPSRVSAMEGFHTPPRCPRSEPHRGHDDWYTLSSMPSLNICPDCFHSTFVDTVFEDSFRRALRNRTTKLKCDFASPWMRLAWRLTHLERRRSLSLLEALARVQSLDLTCPGDKDATQNWHAVSDHRGRQLKHFDVCPGDARKIQILMPTLAAIFEPSDRSAGHRRQCDFREKSSRNEAYLDRLFEVYEEGFVERRKPDVDRFVNFVGRKMEMRECEKGKMVEDAHWYYMPGLESFTVCEDCHHSIIMPARQKGSTIALRFNKVAKPADQKHHRAGRKDEVSRSSCQLWSPRMRRVFKRAEERNDYEYLMKRAIERREVEEGHLMRRASLMKELRREDGLGVESAERIARLEESLQEEEDYWKKWQ